MGSRMGWPSQDQYFQLPVAALLGGVGGDRDHVAWGRRRPAGPSLGLFPLSLESNVAVMARAASEMREAVDLGGHAAQTRATGPRGRADGDGTADEAGLDLLPVVRVAVWCESD